MKRILCALLSAIMLTGGAAALPAMGPLHAKSAALYDASGKMLYEFNAEERLQPASVTKIMTMLLAIEAVDRGDVALTDMVTGSAYAASMGGTQIWLKEGEQLSLDEMLKAIAVGSANDCAVAVGEHLAGTEAAFVEKMNSRAQELGCTGTTFVNANGLDAGEEKTLTTARDLALISAELLKHPKILDYTTIWMDSIRGGQFQLANTNKMLRSYKGLIGLKTGYISQAGFCISAAARRDNMTLIATVMAAPTKEYRMADASALLNYGFANFVSYSPDLSGLPKTLPVDLGKEDTVALSAETVDSVTIEKEKAGTLETRITVPDQLSAPVVQGQRVGEIVIVSHGAELMKVPVTAAQTVERKSLFGIYTDFLRAALMKGA